MAIMKLKDVLDGQAGQRELADILRTAKEKLMEDIEDKQTNADVHALQGQLTRLFYGKPSAFSGDYINTRFAEASEQTIVDIFNNFNFEDNQTGHYGHDSQKSMKPSTLARQLEKGAEDLKRINAQIENLSSEVNLDHIMKLRDQLEEKLRIGKQILRDAEVSLEFRSYGELVGDDFKNAKLIVNQLMGLSKALSTPDVVPPHEAGLLFEKALTMTNFIEDASDAVQIEAAKQLAESLNFGQQSISRGGELIQYTISADNVDKEQLKNKHFKLNKGNMTVTYTFNPGEARQGKMDVQLHYNQPDADDYRVSAKRWSRGHGDLGETSIEAGLGRHGLSLLEAYKFGVLKPQNDWLDGEEPNYMAAQDAHDWAIKALEADIAMGITQGKTDGGAGYANLLIVDTGSEIKVRDMADLILNDGFKLSKYESGKIESEASRIYNSMNNIPIDRTDTYLTNTGTMLDKMKVTIRMNFNDKNSST